MPPPHEHDLQCVLDQPVCCVLIATCRPDSQFLCFYMCVLCVMYCGLRFSYILITVMCMQLLYVLHVHLLRLALQLSCICLVIKVIAYCMQAVHNMLLYCNTDVVIMW